MSHIGRIFFIVITISVIAMNFSKAASLTADQLKADEVVNNYFIALTQGDTNTIKSLLGGDFLEKRKRLLDNPTYPEHLIGIYSKARLEITGNVAGNGSIRIDAVITLDSGETLNRQFLLKKEAGPDADLYTIHAELTPEDMKY